MGHGDFTFEDNPHVACFACGHVLDGSPIRYVSHDRDGDWQFLCGQDGHSAEDGRIVGIGHMLELDPSVTSLSRMSAGNHAERESKESVWTFVDEHEGFIRQHVAAGGWAVTMVAPSEEEGGVGFAYTTGLFHNFKHAELVVVGLRQELMHSMLNMIGDRIRQGESFANGDRLSGVIGDYDVKLHEVKEQRTFTEHVGYSLWFYGGPKFRLFQVLYPDRQSRFPGDAGTAEGFLLQQPVLP